jgi:hypothetical protein
MNPPVEFFDFPGSIFPFTMVFVNAEDHSQILHTIHVDGPGASAIPALSDIHGCPVGVVTIHNDGSIYYTGPPTSPNEETPPARSD